MNPKTAAPFLGVILMLSFPIKPSLGQSAAPAKSEIAQYHDCLLEKWSEIEDWSSDATSVARGVDELCEPQYEAFVRASMDPGLAAASIRDPGPRKLNFVISVVLRARHDTLAQKAARDSKSH